MTFNLSWIHGQRSSRFLSNVIKIYWILYSICGKRSYARLFELVIQVGGMGKTRFFCKNSNLLPAFEPITRRTILKGPRSRGTRHERTIIGMSDPVQEAAQEHFFLQMWGGGGRVKFVFMGHAANLVSKPLLRTERSVAIRTSFGMPELQA